MSASAAHGAPPRMSGVGSPTRRLNSRARRSGSVAPRRSAASPTSTVPSAVTNTTDGIDTVRLPRVTICDPAVPLDGGGGVGRPEVDAEVVGHGGER